MVSPAFSSFIFKTNQWIEQSAGIQTHSLLSMSLLTKPLEIRPPPRQINSGIELITDHQHVKDVGNK